MSRTVAVIWHAPVLDRSRRLVLLVRSSSLRRNCRRHVPHARTVLRIVAARVIGLRRPARGISPGCAPAGRVRHPAAGIETAAVVDRFARAGGVLIIGTAISEIWFTLDEAGRWLFGMLRRCRSDLPARNLRVLPCVRRRAAAASAPAAQEKERKSRWRRRKGDEAAEDEEAETAEAKRPRKSRRSSPPPTTKPRRPTRTRR